MFEDRMAGEASETSRGILLRGIDGGTPLGFLAALGLVRALTERSNGGQPKLSWERLDAWRPVLHGPSSFEEIARVVDEDARAWADSALLEFQYVKMEKNGPKAVGGLAAPLAVVRAWQMERRRTGDELSLEYAAALMCDGKTETAKKTASADDYRSNNIPFSEDVPPEEIVERTFFDFTARNAQFLEQAKHIRKCLDLDRIRAALERGEPDLQAASETRSLDWDPAADTPAAIYTGYRRGLLPVHEWLAFRGLVFFPMTGNGRKVRSTACSGRRLAGEFYWPLWKTPVGADAIRSLVAYPNLRGQRADARKAIGIEAVYCADFTKKADGRSGVFSPARPV